MASGLAGIPPGLPHGGVGEEEGEASGYALGGLSGSRLRSTLPVLLSILDRADAVSVAIAAASARRSSTARDPATSPQVRLLHRPHVSRLGLQADEILLRGWRIRSLFPSAPNSAAAAVFSSW